MARVAGLGSALWKNNSVVGFVLGLITGLGIAIFIAIMILRTPVPFSGKTSRPDGAADRSMTQFADPNQPMLPNRDGTIDAFRQTGAPEEAVPGLTVSSVTPAFLQVGAFRNRDDADTVLARLALIGIEAQITPARNAQGELFRVRVGPVERENLPSVQDQLRANGFEFAVAGSD